MLSGCMRRVWSIVLVLGICGIALGAQWTVAVYMCADNGLNDQAYLDLEEMEEIGSTDEVNIIVQLDNAARDTHPGCRRYRIVKDGFEPLGELGEVDMADTAVLRGFAGFIKRSYPAEHYFLILWDHGNGWSEGYGPSRFIFIDESHGHSMGVAGGELAAALQSVHQALGTRVRVLGFDACLMEMIEVACEGQDCCDYMLASEGLVPLDGWPYDKFLATLVARPTATPEEFLPEMCSAYIEAYLGEDICISAIDMRQLDRLLPVLEATVRDSLNPLDPGFGRARSTVQTFSKNPGRPPCVHDDQIDLMQFWELAAAEGTGILRSVLGPLVVANQARGTVSRAGGLATWFPDNYVEFKAAAASYAKLGFVDSVLWLQFLNAYFASDDVKPTQPVIVKDNLGGRGDIRLWWNRSHDLAPVSYKLYEVSLPVEAFRDDCNDLEEWSAIGWRTSERDYHSLPRAFFSGSGSNLDNQLVLVTPWKFPHGGLLSCYVYFSTEEAWDSASGFKRDICYIDWSENKLDWHTIDSLYGSAQYWQECRYVLPKSGSLYLRFHYVSDSSINRLGLFLDDIKVYAFDTMRTVAEATKDTVFYIFNAPFGNYKYFVTAADSSGNVSMASQFYPSGEPVMVETWAEPYTKPAPFQGSCELCLDFPEGVEPDVMIYTISGILVRKFENVTKRVLEWNGKNAAGHSLADGLYLVVVKAKGFHKTGKIARVGF
ncbi:hypothetical protein CH330_10075 [candidate division WOR-3 bacterium JGI_Cruoil_03_51_56]|uniref:Peptidase C11 clostripain n=1 Tax=candidate division WOR-3 bacterium JGI_Cruoil_03_51_56 TaxID=1973747 RepID=A0A235BNF1_UNCW3|nr:MAG: hypothetical protein CH330_10075 [candidate division WOR-3 bacterium JGI_Cruoil_03_51_56]